DALVAFLAKDERLGVRELEDLFAAGVLFGDTGPGAVVENVAVLKDFNEGGALVRGGLFQGVFQMSLEDVDGAGDESGFGAYGQRNRVEGAIQRAVGGGLGFLIEFRRWRIMSLRQCR